MDALNQELRNKLKKRFAEGDYDIDDVILRVYEVGRLQTRWHGVERLEKATELLNEAHSRINNPNAEHSHFSHEAGENLRAKISEFLQKTN